MIMKVRISERDTCDDGPFESYKAELLVKDKVVAAMDYIMYDHYIHQASREDIRLNMDDLSVNHSEWYDGTLGMVWPHFIYIEDIRAFRKGKMYGSELLTHVTRHYLNCGVVMGGCLPDSGRKGYSDIGSLIGFYEYHGYYFKGQCFYKQPKLGAIL